MGGVKEENNLTSSTGSRESAAPGSSGGATAGSPKDVLDDPYLGLAKFREDQAV